MFDLSIFKILVLGVLALVIFGPERLPQMAGQAGRMLRDLRALADRARSDLHENLGPEFSDFDFTDLNPKTFVRKHLLEDDQRSATTASTIQTYDGPEPDPRPRESPPVDLDAT